MNKTEDHKRICYELNALYDQKNTAYGDSFHRSFEKWGMTMALIRLGDKLNRLESIVLNKQVNVGDESFRDTLLDLANYSIMTLMEIDAEAPPVAWEKEIGEKGAGAC